MASGGQAVLLGYPDEYMAGDREHHTTNKVQYSKVQYSTAQGAPPHQQGGGSPGCWLP